MLLSVPHFYPHKASVEVIRQEKYPADLQYLLPDLTQKEDVILPGTLSI